MAKKKQGAKKLLQSRVNKLKYLSKKYEVIKEVSPRDYIKKPITVNNRKFKSKYEAEQFIKGQKEDILNKLRKTKSYQTLIHKKYNRGGDVQTEYTLLVARYWEREKLEDEIDTNEDFDFVNGMSKEKNMHAIHSYLDFLFSQLDSSSAIGIEVGSNGKAKLFIQETGK